MTVHVTPAVLDAAAGEVARAGGELRAQATALEGSCESVPKIGDVQAGLAFGQAHYDWAHKSSASNAITDYTPPWPTPRACCRPEADGSMRVGTRALRPSRPVPDRTQCRPNSASPAHNAESARSVLPACASVAASIPVTCSASQKYSGKLMYRVT